MAAEVTAPLQFIGGDGGTQHNVKGWEQGKQVTKLRIYSGEWQIKAVRIWLSGDSDNEYKEFGKPGSTNYKEFSFQDQEVVTKMSLWGNGAGTRAGWIYFETNKGRSFDYGMYGWPKKTEYQVDVKSGILVGAIYQAGSDIDAHGYYFLSSDISSTQVTNVKYPTLPLGSDNIAPVELDRHKNTNTSSSPCSWSFAGKKEVTASRSWSVAIGIAFSARVSVKAQVPSVAEVGGEFGWELSDVTTHVLTEECVHSVEWSTGGMLQPGESVDKVALTREGQLSVPYNSTIDVTLKNGASYSFPLSGIYQGVCYTGIEVTDASKTKAKRYVRR